MKEGKKLEKKSSHGLLHDFPGNSIHIYSNVNVTYFRIPITIDRLRGKIRKDAYL